MIVDAHRALSAERRSLVEYLESLDDEDWRRPSLCDAWTVTEVVAHLSLSTTETWRDMLVGMIRHRGNFDRWNATRASDLARRSTPDELLTRLRNDVDSDRHGPGSSTHDQLVDVLVHGQDIALAIGKPLDAPVDPTVEALEHALGSRWYGAKRRFENIHLSATDADWEAGTGDEVTGPVLALLMTATGRTATLQLLEGPGTETLRRRMAPA